MQKTISIQTGCLQCGNVPLLQIDEEFPERVYQNCKCSKNALVLLEKFTASSREQEQICINIFCDKHNQNKLTLFCYQCTSHCCVQCANEEHKNHNIINIANIINEELYDKIQKKYKDAERYIERYLKRIRDECIMILRNKITKVEDTFNRNYEINKRILDVIGVIINDYANSKEINYYTASNLLNNSTFNLKKYNIDVKDVKQVSSIFQSHIILSPRKAEIKSFKHIKTANAFEKRITKLILLKDGRIACNSMSAEVKIFELPSLTLSTTITSPSKDYFYCLTQHQNGMLIASLSDATVILYQPEGKNFKKVKSFLGSMELLFDIAPLTGDRYCTGGRDLYIIIRSLIYPYNSIINLYEGNWTNALLQLKNGKLVSSSDYGEFLKVWDVQNYQCETCIKKVSCYTWKGMVELENKKLAVERKKNIVILDIERFIIEKVIESKEEIGEVERVFEMRDGSLLLGCEKSYFYLIDGRRFEYVGRKENNNGIKVTAFEEIGKRVFITGNNKGMIVIWKY